MAHIDDTNTQKSNLRYIRNAMDENILSKEDELEFARRWREEQDEDALHQLVQPYARLVISMAKKFKHYGLPTGDLIQEGNIGLMMAAERFDPSREIRFSTYSSWWIRSCIQDYILRNWSIVRTGTTAAQKSLFFNFRRLRAKIEGDKEKEGLNDNDRKTIADELSVRVKDVEMMEGRLSGIDQSLNYRIGENENEELQTLLPDEGPNPEDVVMYMKDAETRSEWINNALKGLSDREQKIIKDRHLGYDSITLEQLGKQLGVSKERVRQIESRAMEKLRASLGQNIPNIQDLLTES